MDNVDIVVEDLDTAIKFFGELGLVFQGRGLVEDEWAGRVTGLGDQRVEIAMMRTPDGHRKLELSLFLAPLVVADQLAVGGVPVTSGPAKLVRLPRLLSGLCPPTVTLQTSRPACSPPVQR